MYNNGGPESMTDMPKVSREFSTPENLKQKKIRPRASRAEWTPSEKPHSACKRVQKISQRRQTRHQNGSAKKLSLSNGKPENDGSINNIDTLEASLNAASIDSGSSSSSSTAHSEADETLFTGNHATCSADETSKVACDHGAVPSPGPAHPKDSQVLDVPSSPAPENNQVPEPNLLPELIDDIIGRSAEMREVMKLQTELGKAFEDVRLRPAFRRNRPLSEGEYSPIHFWIDEVGDLQWGGYDTSSREWKRLPSLNFAKEVLPSPDPDLFKDYLVASDGGLLCFDVGKATGREQFVICNPLTRQVKILPPLKFARHPVLMHLKVDHDNGHYKVIVAGSAAIGSEALSLKTEIYDSSKGSWECPDGSDLPCLAFGLNEYQNGVYFKDGEREFLMCIAIIDTRGRGVLVYDITKKKWAQGPHVKQLHIPLVRSEPNISHLATTQIVECGGFVFVFSEQECGRDVYFVIHKLVLEGSDEEFVWEEVMKHKRTGGRGLLVYPEFTCVPVSKHGLCIFNTVEHSIEIIVDLNKISTEVTPLQANGSCTPPKQHGSRFHSLNPIGFVFQPSFRSVVCPRGPNSEILRCDNKGIEYCSECDVPRFTRRNAGSEFGISAGISNGM